VFEVVGCVYIAATLVFGAIPLLQYFRQRSSPLDDMNGATKFETFRISTKRSTSRGSIANGLDGAAPPPPAATAAAAAAESSVSAYGSFKSTGGVEVGGQGYGYGGVTPDWTDTRSGQMSSPPMYGSLQ